jgi:immunoglobulin I-set domain protein
MKIERAILVTGFSISVLLSASVLVAGALTPGADDPNALSRLHLQDVEQLFFGLAEGNGVVVAAASGTILVSTNALQWSRTILPSTGESMFLWNVAYAGGAFIALGRSDVFSIRGAPIHVSYNGFDWESRNLPWSPAVTDLKDVAYGNGRFVIAGSPGFWVSTNDAASWVAAPGQFRGEGIIFKDSRFVAVLATGQILESTTGFEWSTNYVGSNPLYSVTWHNGTFIAVGDRATILTSPDAQNWTLRYTTNSPQQFRLFSVAAHDNTYLAAGQSDSGGPFFISTNGIDWALRFWPQETNILAMVYAHGRFVYSVAPYFTQSYRIGVSDPLRYTAPTFVLNPAGQRIKKGATNELRALASGTSPISYQWHKDGSAILHATNQTLTIADMSTNDVGNYTAVARNPVGVETSSVARIEIGLWPRVLEQPVSTSVVLGGSVTFSVLLEGTPPIVGRWRLPGPTYVTQTVNSATAFLTVHDAQFSDAGTYGFTGYNEWGTGSSSGRQLTVLADSDHDRVPDDWEDAHRFDSTDGADATEDADRDGVSNRDEYNSGTDPNDPQSYLKIQSITRPDGTSIRLSFLAAAAKTYTVQSRPTVDSGPWDRLADIPAAVTAGLVEVQDFISPDQPLKIYRLVTPRAP